MFVQREVEVEVERLPQPGRPAGSLVEVFIETDSLWRSQAQIATVFNIVLHVIDSDPACQTARPPWLAMLVSKQYR